jgi:hypothetical protein
MITHHAYDTRPLSLEAVFESMKRLGIDKITMSIGTRHAIPEEKPATMAEADPGHPLFVIMGHFHAVWPSGNPLVIVPWWLKVGAHEAETLDTFEADFKIWLYDLPEVSSQLQAAGYANLIDERDGYLSVRSRCQYEIDRATEEIKTRHLPELVLRRIKMTDAEQALAEDLKVRAQGIDLSLALRNQ